MKTIEYPFTADKVRELRAGDRVRIAGRLFLARDRVHRYLFDGGTVPVSLADGAIYHCGPIVLYRDGRYRIVAAGPTTSSRQAKYTPFMLEKLGVRLLLGKGGMSPAVGAALARCGGAYVHLVGGAAAVLGRALTEVEQVHLLPEFGMAEALWVVRCDGIEGIVTMDSHGGDLHRRVQERSQRELRRALRGGA